MPVAMAVLLAFAGCGAPDSRSTAPPTATSTVPSAASASGSVTSRPTPPASSSTRPAGPAPRPSASTHPTSPRVAPSTTAAAPVVAGHSAWVSVSVATLWRSPSSPRAVDQQALTAPAGVRGWLGAMTLADRRGLVDRADTQALLGDRVVVTSVQGSWAKVVVPDQPTPLDARGYPGWVPTRQLSATAPATATSVATVTARTAWLRADNAGAAPTTEVSFGTRLPVLTGTGGDWVRVGLPAGLTRRLARSSVAVHAPGSPAQPATGLSLVHSAQAFTGLPYLWAGRSGFGFDCSGLTSLVYRVHGVSIPRDADAQMAAGRAVSSAARGPGDLLFYATSSGYIHHVSMDAGGGLMVQSPATGKTVETIPVSTASYAAQYAGARRFLG